MPTINVDIDLITHSFYSPRYISLSLVLSVNKRFNFFILKSKHISRSKKPDGSKCFLIKKPSFLSFRFQYKM